MSEAEENAPSTAALMFGDFAPALVGFTDDTLFGQVWTRPELSPRDRSLVTVACLVTGGNTAQLVNHLARAKRNGLTETELIEAITHLAFYAGWSTAMAAIGRWVSTAMSTRKVFLSASGQRLVCLPGPP